MSDPARPIPGTIGWFDLTVKHADAVRDFYGKVVGWEADPVDMGGYDDYCMKPPGGQPVAGVCHARDANADMPPQWIAYVVVDDIDGAAQRCRDAGGKVVVEPRSAGGGRMCVIQDPAGAVLGLWQQEGDSS